MSNEFPFQGNLVAIFKQVSLVSFPPLPSPHFLVLLPLLATTDTNQNVRGRAGRWWWQPPRRKDKSPQGELCLAPQLLLVVCIFCFVNRHNAQNTNRNIHCKLLLKAFPRRDWQKSENLESTTGFVITTVK